ncbi:MAG TPA: DUF937 domain-containing protein [Thermoanaerobaculia bacterium]|nr:DUF937 domain-containing protein [Thermoanaerobaculia bacterium]
MIDQLQQQLGPDTISQLSRQLGTDENQTRQALPLALSALVGGLGREAATPQGAQNLSGALDRDHDGSLLDNLGGLLGQSGGGGLGGLGEGILKHVLGGKRPQVESQLGQASGLDAAKMGKLLALLAPIVLAYLGKQKRQRGLDPGGLGEILAGERRQAQQKAQQSGLGGLGGLLDRDGDGDILDDLAGLAGGFLGGGKR